VELVSDISLIRGEEELFDRTAHLFVAATDIACAADDLYTWALSRPSLTRQGERLIDDKRIRKLYRPGVLLDERTAQHLHRLSGLGAQIRIGTEEINETILLDERVAIMAGDEGKEVRSYSVISRPELVQGILSLFETAWLAATTLETFDARFADIRQETPQMLEFLTTGCKDDKAAKSLGMGVRTYQRRVSELLVALGVTSRLQVDARARELGLL